MTHRKNNSQSKSNPAETESLLYFAYGSNLSREQMRYRCPGSKALCPAYLTGYRLAEREYADIEPDAGSVVHGALYAISASDLELLDIYEGYPAGYTRKRVPVTLENGLIQVALVYLMTPECRARLEGRPYPADYRKVCSDGAASWGIPNGFSGKEPEGAFRYQTLFTEKNVSTADALKKLEVHLRSGNGCLRAPVGWIGAGTAVARKRPEPLPLEDFYGPPLYVITPHAMELSWLYGELRDAFNAEKLLDGCTREDCFRRFSLAALEAIEKNSEVGAEELCLKVLDEAGKIYREIRP